jgi:hypothetical protein
MAEEHSLLVAIRAGVEATGWHLQRWGQLRREVFPGTSWTGLKAWCAANAMECELAFSQSSKSAEVQFRRQRKAAAGGVAPEAAAG